VSASGDTLAEGWNPGGKSYEAAGEKAFEHELAEWDEWIWLQRVQPATKVPLPTLPPGCWLSVVGRCIFLVL
jgi:hypothetical protein